MKLLLTSGGIQNDSLKSALVEMLGKPTAECSALCVPTANYAHGTGITRAWEFVSGTGSTPMVDLGWKSMGLLELTALPSIDRELWETALAECECLLVNGGDPLYLHYWMRESGVADRLSTWNGVYVGLSAGSMIMSPRIGQDFVRWTPPTGSDDRTLGLVPFSIFPHLDHPMLPDNTMVNAEKWAATLGNPAYVMDDATGIKVVDGAVEVISEGKWTLLNG